MSNKDKIVEAAIRLFHLYGYNGTSVDMLIKKADVSKSNFYYYFESKEELGLNVLTNLADNQVREFSKIMGTRLNPVQKLVECCKSLVSSHRALFEGAIYPGSFFGNLALEQSSINEKFRSVLDNYFQECEALIEGCLREGVKQGLFNEKLDPKRAACLMVCQFEGAILIAKTRKSIRPIETAVHESKKLLVREEHMNLADEI